MSDKPEKKDDLLEQLKNLWLPVAGFLGAVTLAYNFYQLWLGDQATVTYFLAGGGLGMLIITLIWVGFSTQKITTKARWSKGAIITSHRFTPPYRRAAWVGLSIIVLLAVFGFAALIQHEAKQKQKLIVAIAAFEGPEETYGLRNEIIEKLNADFSSDPDVEIITVREVITSEQGSVYARQLGQRRLADVVIWGWYRPTENPNVTIHIENLDSNQFLPLKKSETLQPIATLAELESFSFQQEAGQETSALISFLAGYIDYSAGNLKTAIARFDQALDRMGASPSLIENQSDVFFYKATANARLGEYQYAIQDYNQAIQINPRYLQAYNNRGLSYENLGEYQRAIQDFSQVIQINPQFAEGYSNRGIAYADLGEYERAIQDYSQAIQINPKFVWFYYNRGNAYDDLGEHQRAIQDYDQAIQITPQFLEAYNNRGVAYGNLGDHQRAIQDFDQIIQSNPQDARAYYNRGNAYSELGEYQRAIQDYSQAIQINPKYANAYYNRGLSYENLGEHQRAIQDFDQAIQINPQDANAYYGRGRSYAILGEYQRAFQDYDQAIQINPQYTNAYNGRGLAYSNLGEHKRAIQDYDQSVLINPQFTDAYYNRGNAYSALGEYQRALQDYDQVIQISPQDANAYYGRGFVYYHLGEYQLAIQAYNQAILINPQFDIAYYSRGMAYQYLGKTTEAEADLAKYKELTGKDAP